MLMYAHVCIIMCIYEFVSECICKVTQVFLQRTIYIVDILHVHIYGIYIYIRVYVFMCMCAHECIIMCIYAFVSACTCTVTHVFCTKNTEYISNVNVQMVLITHNKGMNIDVAYE